MATWVTKLRFFPIDFDQVRSGGQRSRKWYATESTYARNSQIGRADERGTSFGG